MGIDLGDFRKESVCASEIRQDVGLNTAHVGQDGQAVRIRLHRVGVAVAAHERRRTDQEPGLNLLDVRIAPDASLQTARRKDLLGGVVVIEAQGAVVDVDAWQDELYRPAPVENSPQREVTLVAVPYYAWANRGPGAMRVWIPRR